MTKLELLLLSLAILCFYFDYRKTIKILNLKIASLDEFGHARRAEQEALEELKKDQLLDKLAIRNSLENMKNSIKKQKAFEKKPFSYFD